MSLLFDKTIEGFINDTAIEWIKLGQSQCDIRKYRLLARISCKLYISHAYVCEIVAITSPLCRCPFVACNANV